MQTQTLTSSLGRVGGRCVQAAQSCLWRQRFLPSTVPDSSHHPQTQASRWQGHAALQALTRGTRVCVFSVLQLGNMLEVLMT